MAVKEKADRAKLFIPFDALKGFRDALAEKEKIIVDKVELSDEMKEELDRKFHLIERNHIITVVYFYQGEYLQLTGMVSKMDTDSRTLTIINTKLNFDDIYDIQIA